MIRHLLLHALYTALTTLATGWQRINYRWIPLRPSCSGLAPSPNTTSRWCEALELGSDTVTANDHVQVLAVTILSDLNLEKLASKTCAPSFNWLCYQSHFLTNQRQCLYMLSWRHTTTAKHTMQGHRRQSLTSCNEWSMLSPSCHHVVSDTWKFDHGLSAIPHSELHWLDVPERINGSRVRLRPRHYSGNNPGQVVHT